MRTVPSVLLFATVLTTSGAALAETAPPRFDAACDDPSFAPHVGAVVPANTPAFPFQVRYGEYAFALRLSSFELVATHIDVDPATTGGQLLVPLAPPLAEGSYALHFNSPCNPSYLTSDHSQSRVFTVGPAAPLPTKAGTLTVIGDTYTEDAEWCVDVRATRTIRIDIDPLLVPFLETTRVSLSEPGMIVGEYGNFPGASRTIKLASSCQHPSPTGGPPATTLTLGAHLAGVPDLESTSVDVQFLCDPGVLARCKPGTPGVGDAHHTDGGPFDAGWGGIDYVDGDTRNSSSGCSFHAFHASRATEDATSAGATLGLAAALAALRSARGRRRRAA